ncbi:MAG: hypothetical protein K0S26_1507 [Bacteroidota bacterium]|jgi:hypothetical protein|nr:hypothetical protein [Bacteroidota bacterium]
MHPRFKKSQKRVRLIDKLGSQNYTPIFFLRNDFENYVNLKANELSLKASS